MSTNEIQKIFNGQNLTKQESKALFNCIAQGQISEIQLSAILLAMKTRGVSADEITGAAQAFLANAQPFPIPQVDFADIVGTGGDGANTINISVTSAIVASCCGAKIIKHGSRSVSSKSGASDLLSAFGYPIDLSAQHSRKVFDKFNFCFLFAPLYHPAFKYAATVRQQLKTRTIFNILGPLLNPAQSKKILIGVYAKSLLPLIAQSLKAQDYQHAIVVYGAGIDEVNLADSTDVAELKDGNINYYSLTASDFALSANNLTDLVGDTAQVNKQIISNILQGKGSIGQQHAIAANVALLLKLFGQPDIKANAQQALQVLKSAVAYQHLQQIITFAQNLANE